jgi:type II secretory pathway component PulJ
LELLDDWLSRRRELRSRSGANPRELAVLLGKLVFASQVVWNGQPFMQAMLSSFAGCEVDWKRGMVTMDGVRSAVVQLSAGFWRDLQWWRDHIGERFSVPWETPEEAAAVLSGTDASG